MGDKLAEMGNKRSVCVVTRVLAHSGPLMPCLTPHVFSGYVSVSLLSDEHLEAAVAETDGWACQEGMPLSAGHRGIQNSPTQKRGWTRWLKVLSEQSCLFIYLIRGLGHQSPFLPVPRADAIRPRVMPQPPAVGQCVAGYLECGSECSLTRQNSREAWEE